MSEAIVTIALAISVALNAVGAVLILRLSSNAFLTLDRAHERTTKYTEGLVDRIISGDWQTYKAYAMMEEAPTADVEPEPAVPTFTEGPDRGGFASKLGLRALSERHVATDEARVRASEEQLMSDMQG